MKKIKIDNKDIIFDIYNPGGNITALVIDDNYSKKEKKEINDYLLKTYSYVEQVGFMENNNLEMAGGELCINASRCAIYYLNSLDKKLELNILNKKIVGDVSNNYVSIKYIVDEKLNDLLSDDNTICFDGISLVFLNKEENNKLLRKIYDKNINDIMKEKIKKKNIDDKAIGVVLTDEKRIYPFIWVRDIDTLYFETACGSASIAYALFDFKKTGKTNYTVIQPSNYEFEIEIVENNKKIEYILFKGIVEEYKEEGE